MINYPVIHHLRVMLSRCSQRYMGRALLLRSFRAIQSGTRKESLIGKLFFLYSRPYIYYKFTIIDIFSLQLNAVVYTVKTSYTSLLAFNSLEQCVCAKNNILRKSFGNHSPLGGLNLLTEGKHDWDFKRYYTLASKQD